MSDRTPRLDVRHILIANRGEIALRVRCARPRSSASPRSPSSPPPTRRRCTSSSPTRASASDRPLQRTAISTFPPSSPPARSPAPTPSTPAMGSYLRTRGSRTSSKSIEIAFIGPKAEHIRLMGDKDRSQAHRGAARHPLRPRLRGRDRGRGGRAPDRGGNRLPGDRESGGGRGRSRHEGRTKSGRAGQRYRQCAHRSQDRLRRRRGLP